MEINLIIKKSSEIKVVWKRHFSKLTTDEEVSGDALHWEYQPYQLLSRCNDSIEWVEIIHGTQHRRRNKAQVLMAYQITMKTSTSRSGYSLATLMSTLWPDGTSLGQWTDTQ